MRTDRIPSDDRAGTGARPWRVDHSGPGAGGGPDAPAPGGATRRALSVWPPGPPGTPVVSDPRPGRGPDSSRPSPGHLPGDEDEIEFGFSLPNNTVVIPAVLARLRERAAQFGLFDEKTADRVAVALTEALVNGIQHGNLELDSRLRREDEATYDRMAEFRRRRPPYRDRRLTSGPGSRAARPSTSSATRGRGSTPPRCPTRPTRPTSRGRRGAACS